MPGPLGALRFLYVGSEDVPRDLAYYVDVLGGERVWDLTGFGTRVAAVRLGSGPLVLLAGHRPPRSVIVLYQVDDLEAAATALRERGWRAAGERFEIPNGPCYLFHDPTGNELGIFEDVRPYAATEEFGEE